MVSLADAAAPGLLVKSEVAQKQREKESAPPPVSGQPNETSSGSSGVSPPGSPSAPVTAPTPAPTQPKRFHGAVVLDPARVGRDASRIAEEVIAHLSGLVGAKVTVSLEVEAEILAGVPDNVVRTVTENSRTLKFTVQGFEKE
jgi:hypothetical protein